MTSAGWASPEAPSEAALIARRRIATLLEDARAGRLKVENRLRDPKLPADQRQGLRLERAKLKANLAALTALEQSCLEDAEHCASGFRALLPTLQRFDRRYLQDRDW